MSEDLLYEEIYQKTQNCGRTQFVKLLQQNQIKIEQLQQENKELKEILENNSKINIADHKYASEMEDKYLIEHNVLTEFEKWLETKLQKESKVETSNETTSKVILNKKYYVFNECLDKLQELKEGKNEKSND